MASPLSTRDHSKIKTWIEKRGGKPALASGTPGELRIDFGKPLEKVEQVGWNDFFRSFDEQRLNFLYDPEKKSTFNKFIDDNELNNFLAKR